MMASCTQETRVSTRPKLQVGAVLDPGVYEKWLRTGGAAILEASRTDATHIGGEVASILAVPIHAPGGRPLGLLEFVNKAETLTLTLTLTLALTLALFLTIALTVTLALSRKLS